MISIKNIYQINCGTFHISVQRKQETRGRSGAQPYHQPIKDFKMRITDNINGVQSAGKPAPTGISATPLAFKRLVYVLAVHGIIWNDTKDAEVGISCIEDVYRMDRLASYLGRIFDGRNSPSIRAKSSELIAAAAGETRIDMDGHVGPIFSHDPDFEDHNQKVAESASTVISGLIGTMQH
jgi:hypothetical protein